LIPNFDLKALKHKWNNVGDKISQQTFNSGKRKPTQALTSKCKINLFIVKRFEEALIYNINKPKV